MPTLGRHTDFGLGTPCRSRVARWKPRIAEPMMATLIEQGRVGVRKKTNPRTATNSKCTVCIYLVLRLPWPAHGFWPRHAMSKPSGALEAPHCGANDGYPNRTRPGWGSQIEGARKLKAQDHMARMNIARLYGGAAGAVSDRYRMPGAWFLYSAPVAMRSVVVCLARRPPP